MYLLRVLSLRQTVRAYCAVNTVSISGIILVLVRSAQTAHVVYTLCAELSKILGVCNCM